MKNIRLWLCFVSVTWIGNLVSMESSSISMPISRLLKNIKTGLEITQRNIPLLSRQLHILKINVNPVAKKLKAILKDTLLASEETEDLSDELKTLVTAKSYCTRKNINTTQAVNDIIQAIYERVINANDKQDKILSYLKNCTIALMIINKSFFPENSTSLQEAIMLLRALKDAKALHESDVKSLSQQLCYRNIKELVTLEAELKPWYKKRPQLSVKMPSGSLTVVALGLIVTLAVCAMNHQVNMKTLEATEINKAHLVLEAKRIEVEQDKVDVARQEAQYCTENPYLCAATKISGNAAAILQSEAVGTAAKAYNIIPLMALSAVEGIKNHFEGAPAPTTVTLQLPSQTYPQLPSNER